MADEFKPERNILAQLRLQAVPRGVLTPTINIEQRKANQSKLNAIWQKVEEQRNQLATYLDQKLRGKNHAMQSDLFGGLVYAADRLRSEVERMRAENVIAEQYLLVLSDLEMDFGKQKTLNPPAKLADWRGVNARLLFVPYDASWAQRRLNWEGWFNQGQAKSSILFDVSQSSMEPVVAAGGVPRKIPPMDSKAAQISQK